MEVLSSEDPVPLTTSAMYLEELETILVCFFRNGILEIIFGVLLCFFALQILVWPFALGVLCVIAGINAICHFRDYMNLLTNGCCCGTYSSVLTQYYLQPFLFFAALGSSASACVALHRALTAVHHVPTANIAQVGVGLGASLLILWPTFAMWRYLPRAKRMVEVHPEIGDPDKVREHNGLHTGLTPTVIMVEAMRRVRAMGRTGGVSDDDDDDDNNRNGSQNRTAAVGMGSGGSFVRTSPRHFRDDDGSNSAFAAHHQAQQIMALHRLQQQSGLTASSSMGMNRAALPLAAPVAFPGVVVDATVVDQNGNGNNGNEAPAAVSVGASGGPHEPPQFGYTGTQQQSSAVYGAVVPVDGQTNNNNAPPPAFYSPTGAD